MDEDPTEAESNSQLMCGPLKLLTTTVWLSETKTDSSIVDEISNSFY